MHNLLKRGCCFRPVTSNSETNNNSSEDSNDNLNTAINSDSNMQWIDFRTTAIEDLSLEFTGGVEINRDLERGLWASGTGGFFTRTVKFGGYQWLRSAELPFSFVFTTTGSSPSFLFGIGNAEIDVNNIGNQVLFAGEIQMFCDNGRFNRFFGGGGVNNWVQDTGSTIQIEEAIFYKVSFERSGKVGSKITMHTVNSSDFTVIDLVGEYTVGDNPANNPNLTPFWNAVSTPNVFITAIEVPGI